MRDLIKDPALLNCRRKMVNEMKRLKYPAGFKPPTIQNLLKAQTT